VTTGPTIRRIPAAGLDNGRRRHFSRNAYDLELVFRLCVMPGCIPFDPLADDLDALLALERDLDSGVGIVLSEVRYLIEARKT
jgi:hypothetical protein